MTLTAIGTYQPTWVGPGEARVAGLDEDVTTLAVAAGRTALGAAPAAAVERVVVVTRRPDVLEGFAGAVVALGLGLAPELPVELRIGGAAATLDALLAAAPGTLVIGADAAAPAGAAAALVGAPGASLAPAGRVSHPLPMRVQRVGEPAARSYDDPRLERERGWRRAVQQLGASAGAATDAGTSGADAPAGSAGATAPLPALAGLAARDARRLGGDPGAATATTGAAAPLFALATRAEQGRDGRIVALDAGESVAADTSAIDRVTVAHAVRPGIAIDAGPQPPRHPAEIPIALPAYDRALVAKAGLIAARCACGELSYPPRRHCLACGREGQTQPQPLPRDGEVYTTVRVRVPVPGVPGPYALAVVELDGVGVRVLVHVTDAPIGAVAIGDRGRLVLRRIAVRAGIDDYGYGWQPALAGTEEQA